MSYDESPSRPISQQRRVSKAAHNRIGSIESDHRTMDTTAEESTLANTFVASRKMSAVDSTFRNTLARNNVDNKSTAEATTDAELNGWYMYDFANGAFFYSVLNFLPILIAGQAAWQAKVKYCRDNDVWNGLPEDTTGDCSDNNWAKDYDNAGVCLGAAGDGGCTVASSYVNQTCVEDGGTWEAAWRDDAIFVNFLGMKIGYASVSFMCTCLSVVAQLFVFVGFGGLADYGNLRKTMFIGANTVGSICCILVWFGDETSLFWYNGVLMMIANVSYGFAVVFYNAYLPLLIAAHPDVTSVAETATDDQQIIDAANALSSKVSTRGFATGFCGQLIFLIFNFILLTVIPDGGLAVRINVMLCGFWTLVFGGYCFFHLKPRPGPPLPDGQNFVSVSFNQIVGTFASAKDLPQLFLYLLAYFIFSDGCSTLAGSAALFAAIELKMASADIMLGILLVSLSAIASCVIWFNVEKHFKLRPKTILILNLVILGCMPIYGIVAMTCQWEFYMMCLIFGLNTGSQQAYTRSIFSSIVPQGHEAEYFSLYEVTDKGTAWAGPLVVGAVFDATGNFRDSFGALLAFFVVGIFVLSFFDPEKAAAECKAFELKEKLTKKKGGSTGDSIGNSSL